MNIVDYKQEKRSLTASDIREFVKFLRAEQGLSITTNKTEFSEGQVTRLCVAYLRDAVVAGKIDPLVLFQEHNK